MDEYTCFKRRKRSYSNEILLEYSDTDSDEIFFDPKKRMNSIDFKGINTQKTNNKNENENENENENKNENENDLVDLLNNINKLNIDSNKDLFTKILKKINDLEKKVETFFMINIKIDTLKKDIDKILIEKDYVIENLKYEITDLKDQLKDTKNDIDLITHKSGDSYYS